MKDLISIIIPAYNIEKYIDRCLISVVNQTHLNFEIIIINDGSTDKTGKIIDRFAEKDCRIKVIHKENTGVSDTRNKGLDIAKGEYIGFVDGDDEVYPDMFEFLLKNSLKYDADISHCGFELVTPVNTKPFYGTGNIYIQQKQEATISLLEGHPFEPSTCNKLYSKEILKRIRFKKDIRFNEDLLFNVEAFKKSKKSVFVDVIKYKYMHNASSASHSEFSLEILKDVIEVATRIKKILADSEIANEANKFYANKIINVLKTLHEKKLSESEFGIGVVNRLKKINCISLGFRIFFLKILLIWFSWFYDLLRIFYDKFFLNRQKWKF